MIDFSLRTDIVKGIDHSYYYQVYTTSKGRRIINRYRKGFTIICHYFLQWGALYLSYDTSHFSRASKKASIFIKNLKGKK